MTRISIFLIVLALIAGLVGCQPAPAKRYTLTISSTTGGKVISPGEGTFTYDEGEVVELVAQADVGYQFDGWTGDVGTVADVGAATTTITMSGDFAIAAHFRLARTGAFLDEVIITTEPSAEAAIERLKNDSLDIYAGFLFNATLYQELSAHPDLRTVTSVGITWEFTFNPVGPVFPATGKLNPFAVAEFREAMNWLVNREYIVGELMGGLGVPKYTCLHSSGVEGTVRFPALVNEMKTKYAHNPTKAKGIIDSVMAGLNATKEGGKWIWNGEQVEIIGLIRTEDERKQIGDYFGGLLADLGFKFTTSYGTFGVLLPIWLWDDPAAGKYHFYTGGWGSAAIVPDEAHRFAFFYTKMGRPELLWQAYNPPQVFYDAAEKLWNLDYTSWEERAQLFETCMRESMKFSCRIFLADRISFTPTRQKVRMASDAWGGVRYPMWAQTAHFVDAAGKPQIGGTMRIATMDMMTQPWNPVAGSNSIYDMMPIHSTGDMDTQPDTRTGLRWARRLEKAEVFVKQRRPCQVTNTEWCKLSFVTENVVPGDAWADWDAKSQKFITVAERFGSDKVTAVRKSVAYFPKDIFKFKLHDGSTLSLGDFLMRAIIYFDRAKPESAIYDEATVADFQDFMKRFKGFKFITDDPNYGLIVEFYSDLCQLNAELNVDTWWPNYAQGPGVWHTIALGVLAETDKALAFSQPKSSRLGVEWMSFIAGPSIPILKSKLDSAKAANYIPYEPTMGRYVTKAEAAQRWSNLEKWYSNKGHFWVASGPFYLESADPVNKVVRLKRFGDYPDPADRWLFLLEPLP